MLANITWQGYWTTLALLTAGYYLAIYLLYFRSDLKVMIPKGNPLTKAPSASPAVRSFLKEQVQPSLFPHDDVSDFDPPSPESEEHLVYACMDELNAYFESSKRTRCVKQELLFALQHILSNYPSIRGSEFQEAITNVIVSEAKQHCSIQLNGEEMNQVWLER